MKLKLTTITIILGIITIIIVCIALPRVEQVKHENAELRNYITQLEIQLNIKSMQVKQLQDDITGLNQELRDKSLEMMNQTAKDNTVWQTFVATAYTSNDTGVNEISAIGMNIHKWSKYFNFVAVDPDIIPYGSVVLIDINNEIEPYLAVDCGGAIKGYRLDLYMQYDLDKAFNWGVREVRARVIE